MLQILVGISVQYPCSRLGLLLNWSALVHGIYMPLVHINEEDDVISEAGQPVHCRHLDNEGKEVVDESIDELEHEVSPR
jgi:hypothetical protein